MIHRTLLVASVCALVACSEDESPPAQPVGDTGVVDTSSGMDTSPDTTVASDGAMDTAMPFDAASGPFADFCRNTFGKIATRFDGCCTASDKMRDEYMFISAILGGITEGCAIALTDGAAKGRVSLDDEKARDCVASFMGDAGAVCGPEVFSSLESIVNADACKGAVKGMQAAGAACAGDHECQDGLTCIGATDKADGKCATPPAIGSTCGPGSPAPDVTLRFGTHPQCASGAYCDGGTCAALVASGGSCVSKEECAGGLNCHLGKCSSSGPSMVSGECNTDSDCVDTAYCVTGDGGAGSCAAKKAAGAMCTGGFFGGSECKGVCAVPDGGMSGTCAAFCGSG